MVSQRDTPHVTGDKSVVLGVTADVSLGLMRGLPLFLTRRGWTVHVVSSPGPMLQALAEVPGVHPHGLPMERKPSPLKDVWALMAWARLLRRIKPQAVAVGTPKAGLLSAMAAWMVRVPRRIYILRGLRLETAVGTNRRILEFLERVSSGATHATLAVGPSLARRYIELQLAKESKVVVLGSGSSNGVDVMAHQLSSIGNEALADAARAANLQDGIPVVGFVGRLARDKGLNVLADALAEITHRGVSFQLLVVGSLDDDESGELIEELKNSAQHSSFVGRVSDTRPYYHLMDVLCLPSLREGFPNVVLEAAASGVPAVVSDATGAVDSVINKQTGLVFPSGDADALADRLATIIQDRQQQQELGESARARAAAEFEQEKVWALFEAFLNDSGAARQA